MADDKRPVTHGVFRRVMGVIGKEVNRHVRDRLAPLEARIAELERRLHAAEERKSLVYRGTWSASIEYGHSDVITSGGSLWICQGYGIRSKPGSSDSWRLIHKGDLPNG